MSNIGTPNAGFPSGNPDNERDSLRLLLLMVGILLVGGAALAALNLGLF